MKFSFISFILGSYSNVIWYLGTVLVGYLALFGVSKVSNRKKRYMLVVLLLVLFSITYLFSSFWDDASICGNEIYALKTRYDTFLDNERIWIFRLPWFFFGCMAGMSTESNNANRYKKIMNYLFYVCGIIMIISSYTEYGGHLHRYFRLIYQLFVMIWYMILGVKVLSVCRDQLIVGTKLNIKWGRLSTIVYCLHVTVIWIIEVLQHSKFIPEFSTVVFFLIVSLITVSISAVVSKNDKLYAVLF